jgi:short chain dehydrogenase
VAHVREPESRVAAQGRILEQLHHGSRPEEIAQAADQWGVGLECHRAMLRVSLTQKEDQQMWQSEARPVAVVVGVGPGLGGSLARRFAEKYAVAINARTTEYLHTLASDIRRRGGVAFEVQANVANVDEVQSAFELIRTQIREPQVLLLKQQLALSETRTRSRLSNSTLTRIAAHGRWNWNFVRSRKSSRARPGRRYNLIGQRLAAWHRLGTLPVFVFN